MSLPKTFPLKAADGKTIEIPSIGFGTWAAGVFLSMFFKYHKLICLGETGWCKDATLEALRAGYRHLDCAWMYGVRHHSCPAPPLGLEKGTFARTRQRCFDEMLGG